MATPEDEEFAAADALVRAAAFPRVNAGDLASIVALLAAEPTIVTPFEDSRSESRMFYEGPDLCLVEQLELVAESSSGTNLGQEGPKSETSQDSPTVQRAPPLVVQYFGMIDPTQYVAAGSGGICWNGSILLARFLAATPHRSLPGLQTPPEEASKEASSNTPANRSSEVEKAAAALAQKPSRVVVELGAGATGVPGLSAARALLKGITGEVTSAKLRTSSEWNSSNKSNTTQSSNNDNESASDNSDCGITQQQHQRLRVVLTDSRSKLVPLLERNIALNSLPGGWLDSNSSNTSHRTTENSTSSSHVEVFAAQLDWREAVQHPNPSSEVGSSIDASRAQDGESIPVAEQPSTPMGTSSKGCNSNSNSSTPKPLLGHLVADHEVDLVLGAEVIWAGIDAVPLVATVCRLLQPRTGRAVVVMPVGGRGAEGIFLNEAKHQGLVHLHTLTLPSACAEPTCPPSALFTQPAVGGEVGGNLTCHSLNPADQLQASHAYEADTILQSQFQHALNSELVNSEIECVKDEDNTEDYHLHIFNI